MKHGFDIPDQLRDTLKTNDLGMKINIESKLSYREKLKARKDFEKHIDEKFF